jgi:glycerol-3-phosphate dehydrogenase
MTELNYSGVKSASVCQSEQPPKNVLGPSNAAYNLMAAHAMKLQRELDEALKRCNGLNRRLTKAEGIIAASGIVKTRSKTGSGGLGRALANYAADQYKRERDKYCRAVELIAEYCEAWLKSESDEPSVEFIKLVAKYAREHLTTPLNSPHGQQS